MSEPGVTDQHDLARLRAVLDSAHEAFVSMDADGRLLEWNRAAQAIFGWSREEVLGRSLGDVVVPERLREAYREGLSHYLRTRESPLIGRRVEATALNRDGSEVPVELSIAPLEEDGVLVFNAFLRDITDRDAALRTLREARGRFEGAFANAPIGMALVAPDGRFLEVNVAICRLLGRPEGELLKLDFQAITHPEDLGADLEGVRSLLTGASERYAAEKRYVLPDGRDVWARSSVSLLRDGAGDPLYFISQLEDIDERKRGEEELRVYTERLRSLSSQDPLTGLRNMREFQRTLDSELERARRHRMSFAVVLLDVVGFRAYNAEHGQGAGDRALRQLGNGLRGSVRGMDIAARVGGDEFGMLLPQTDHDDAAMVVERVTGALAGIVPGLSVTAGVAVWPHAGDGKDELLLRADMALYANRPDPRSPVAEAAVDAVVSSKQPLRIEQLLTLAREQLGMELAYLAEMVDGEQVFRLVEGSLGDVSVEAGTAIPRAATICDAMLSGDVEAIVPDVGATARLAELPSVAQAGVGAYVGAPVTLSDGRLYGTLCCLDRRAQTGLGQRDQALLQFMADIVAEDVEREERERRERRQLVSGTGVGALVAALEARDHYTSEHSQAVVALAGAVARRLGLSEDEVLDVEQVAVLHDIGKVGIPDSILQKHGPLDESEWQLMREHPALGARIIARTESLGHLAPIIRAEHERWDGGGYPDGLKGADIPVAARIVFACDAFHAMTSDRPYRSAMAVQDALAELRANAGTQFDPVAAGALEAEVLQEPATDGSRIDDEGLSPPEMLTVTRPRAPAWEPLDSAGGQASLGSVRTQCRSCGAHVMAVVGSATLSGSCGNCGGQELELLKD